MCVWGGGERVRVYSGERREVNWERGEGVTELVAVAVPLGN